MTARITSRVSISSESDTDEYDDDSVGRVVEVEPAPKADKLAPKAAVRPKARPRPRPTCAPMQGAPSAFKPSGARSNATAKSTRPPGPLSHEQEKKAAKVAQLQLTLQRLKHMHLHHAVSDDVSASSASSAAESAPSKTRAAIGQANQLQNDVAELRAWMQTQADEQRRVQERSELLDACVANDWGKGQHML